MKSLCLITLTLLCLHTGAATASDVATPGHRRTTTTIHRLIGGHKRITDTAAEEFHDDDTELITSGAGEGRDKKDNTETNGGGGSEEKKTLSQQVADGKYGLIQKELFANPAKRPGVISYDVNPDVPNDNINNLGGLSKNDIWLAENHLLVIKGGAFPPHDAHNDYYQPVWDPIDDYKAPTRQVKLPAHPKVPPPFPVQLYDDGPLQILGTNSTTTLNGSALGVGLPFRPISPEEGGFVPALPFPAPAPGIAPPGPGDPNQGNPFAGRPPQQGSQGNKEYLPPPQTGTNPQITNLPPYFANLPPGAAILPPPENFTEYDEDDPSIYYPPPYSFVYQMDNTTSVPPGPLVPGIVLPPPPNFFAPLNPAPQIPKRRPQPTTSTTTTTTSTTTTTTPSPPIKQIRPTTTPIPPTRLRPTEINNLLHEVTTTPLPPPPPQPPKVITIVPVVRYNQHQGTSTTTSRPQYNVNIINERRKKPQVPVQVPLQQHHKQPSVTVLKPVKQNSGRDGGRPNYYYDNNNVVRIQDNIKPFKIYGPPPPQHQPPVQHQPPPSPPRTVISTTQIPLKAYYTSNEEIDSNSVVKSPPRDYYNKVVVAPKQSSKEPAQYYFYEEEAVTNSITTPRSVKINNNNDPYYNIPKEYYVPVVRKPQPQNQYYYETRPQQPPRSQIRFVETTKKPDTFSIHVARLRQQIHEFYTTQEPVYRHQNNQPTPKPVYQYSFEAANYKKNTFRASPPIDVTNENSFKPMYNVEIQPAIEVIPTQATYRNNYYQQQPKQIVSTTTERPRYYEDYNDYDERVQVVTPKPISQFSFGITTPSTNYYTKQDDTYFDDITKKYFTIFGKKIPNNNAVTTPLPPPPPSPSPKQRVNPHFAEITKYVPLPNLSNKQQQQQQPQQQQQQQTQQKDPGSYISYELPGDDGAHFYFLTPQLAQSRDQGAGFYFSNPNVKSRIRRRQEDRTTTDNR